MKHTKILATYGPAIASVDMLRTLVAEGVNAFRVNCSHGKKSDFIEAVETIRKATEDSEYPIGLLFDISGPKLRLDHFEGEIELSAGDDITITSGSTDISKRIIGVNHPAIIESVTLGERLLIDDGNLILQIQSIDDGMVVARAMNHCRVLPGKGINLPDTDIKIPTITEKDVEDIATAIEVGADFIALSFVRSGDDIITARKILKERGGRQKIIAKLEKKEAIDRLDEIMVMADGVMVARGDLGVELPPSELPRLQKKIIKMANRYHLPVIIATQMLESMRFSPRATRAEINDVATAVFDFTDAVMLSAETATGEYPVETVQTMVATIKSAEDAGIRPPVHVDEHLIKAPIALTIANAVSTTDQSCQTKCIFALTSTGYTAGLISNLFLDEPVFALTADRMIMRHLSLYRSVYPVLIEKPGSFSEMLTVINQQAEEKKIAETHDRVIITGGYPFGKSKSTNFMMVHEID